MYGELGVRATVHMDPIVTDDEKISELKALTTEAVKQIDSRLTIHDFRFVEGVTHSNLIFDVAAPFELKHSDALLSDMIDQKIKQINPIFNTVVTIDRQ